MDDKQKKLPAGGTTFSAGGFGVRGDNFFSSGGDKIPNVTTKRRYESDKTSNRSDRLKILRMKTSGHN